MKMPSSLRRIRLWELALTAAVIVVLGACVAMMQSVFGGVVQRDASPQHRGRILSWYQGCNGMAYGIGLLGMGAMQYLRRRRLELAHRALRAANPHEDTVAEIAMRYGFWELGRFAGTYRARFGEPPSATLRRPRALT